MKGVPGSLTLSVNKITEVLLGEKYPAGRNLLSVLARILPVVLRKSDQVFTDGKLHQSCHTFGVCFAEDILSVGLHRAFADK